MQIKIAVRTLADKVSYYDVNENDSVEAFQAMLAREQGPRVEDQTLLLRPEGRMAPGRLLAHYNPKGEQSIEVLLVRALPERPKFNPPVSKLKLPGVASRSGGKTRERGARQALELMLTPMPPLPPNPPPPQTEFGEISPFNVPQTVTAGQVPMIRPPQAAKVRPVSHQEIHLGNELQAVSPTSAVVASPTASGTVAPPPPSQPEAKKAREDSTKLGGATPQLPISRPGTPRGGSAALSGPSLATPSLSQPCTPRTPATPHPVASWAPPAICGTPTAAVRNGKKQTSSPLSSRMTSSASSVSGVSSSQSTAASVTATSVLPSIRPPPANMRIRRADLSRVGRLGVGAFGVVTLEMDRRTGRTYALKAVSKGYLAQLHMEHSVLNEKRILKMVDTPFIVRLLATYRGVEHVYFLLEAALGGELFTTYERLRLYGSESHAKFYVGCCVEALVHLHERNVIYRDLKPENLLLDARGYCKLTDMGLAKVTDQLTYTLVGTPDYMAPEVINCTGHNKTVDWWMLGVLLFELLVGRPPFEADTTEKVYESVRKGIEAVVFPPECRKASDLVRALCHQEAEERIGANETRRNQWYRGFDWLALRACRIPPPHVPHVKGPKDLSNFRSCDQEDPPRVPYKDKGTGWDNDFEDDTPTPAVAASVGALPVQSTSAATSTPPVEAPTRGQAASLAAAQAEALAAFSNLAQSQSSSPRNVPSWAWTTSACPTPSTGPPSFHVQSSQPKKNSKEYAPTSKGAIAWPQRDLPSSPVVGGA